jgi:hypothetical protein
MTGNSSFTCRRALHAGALALLAMAAGATPALGAAGDCTRQSGPAPQAGAAIQDPVTLSAEPNSVQKLRNFDTSRAPKQIRLFVLQSDKRLPNSVTPAQLGFDASLERASTTLETVDFKDPTYSEPRISADRRKITFNVCLDPAGLDAGKYVGTVTVSGPEGLSDASVGITANLKESDWFWRGSIAAGLIAFLLLLFKGTSSKKKESENWRAAFVECIADPVWWVSSAIALGAAFGALWRVYVEDPAWGATGLGAALALVGTAFAAVGGQALLSSFKPGGTA